MGKIVGNYMAGKRLSRAVLTLYPSGKRTKWAIGCSVRPKSTLRLKTPKIKGFWCISATEIAPVGVERVDVHILG